MRGRDIKKYSYDFADLWLIWIPWHFPLHLDRSITGASQKAEQEFTKQFPAIYNHLLQYKNLLSDRNKAETGIRYEWYALQRWGANYWEDFSKQKIVWKRVGSILRFCYDESGCMALDSTCFATGKNIPLLVALLNSPMGHYLLKDSPKTGTGDLLVSVQAVEPIMIPVPLQKDKLIDYANDLIHNYSRFKEDVFNDLVYALYGLTKEEINFIVNRKG